ncbi:MAG TPA: hypothetical protein VHJ19_11400 [Gammaproteobacteria bacterium]|nr:hypothetical protein [Gammaproteobacteria bacterium]
MESIIAQLATTRSGAILLMVELYQYPQVIRLLKRVRRLPRRVGSAGLC